jgi:hypothetical protein
LRAKRHFPAVSIKRAKLLASQRFSHPLKTERQQAKDFFPCFVGASRPEQFPGLEQKSAI